MVQEDEVEDDDVILNEKPPPLVVIDDGDDDDCSKDTYDVYVVYMSDKEELDPAGTLQNVEAIVDEKDDPLYTSNYDNKPEENLAEPDSVPDVDGFNYVKGCIPHPHKYKCPVCGRVVSCNNSLKRHMKIHTKKTLYECDFCHKRYREISDLKIHKRINHSYSIKPFNCYVCYRNLAMPDEPEKCYFCTTKLKQKPEAAVQLLKKSLLESKDDDEIENISDCSITDAVKKKSFNCSYCDKVFVRNYSLKCHMMIHTGEKPFSCSACHKTFRELGGLKRHYRVHTGKKPYKRVQQASEDDDESNITTKKKSRKCSYCNKVFDRNYSLKRHMMIHTDLEPFSCTTCDQTFRELIGLQKHYRVHTGEKSDICDMHTESKQKPEAPDDAEVEMQLSKKSFPDDEIDIGSDCSMTDTVKKKNWKCSDCDKVYGSKYNLQRHVTIHSCEKMFSCTKCNKTFRELSDLQRHNRVHTGEKPYECSICGNLYHYYSSLYKHLRIHTGEKQYKCEICGRNLSSKNNLQYHIQTHFNKNS